MRPADSERSTKRDILTKANNVFSRGQIPVVCFTALAVLVFGCRMLEAQSARQVHGHETVAQSDIQLDQGLHASGKKHPSPPGKPISITSPTEGTRFPTAPVRLEVRLSHGAHAAGFRAVLNGHEVTDKFGREHDASGQARPRRLVASVFPNDGLRRGRNRLLVELPGERGGPRQSTQTTFFVEGPTAKAGADLRLKVGRTAWLDGAQSLSSLPLTHQWVLVDKPERSDATLSDPSSPTLSLVPDVVGTYVARLVVHDGYFRSEPDTMSISASPAGLLVPVNTAVRGPDNNYIIKVGDQEFSSDPAATPAGLQIVALSPTTLAPIGQGTFGTGTGSSFEPIENFLNALQLGVIVIISSTDSSGTHNAQLGELLAGNGTTPAFGANSEIGAVNADSTFTFIGVKGYKYDQALQIGSPSPDFSTYFLQDASGSYKTFQRDFVKFLIKDPVNPDTITVGDQVYVAPPLPPGAMGGFQVVIVDRFNLRPLPGDNFGNPFNKTYATGSEIDPGQIDQMAADLNGLANIAGESALFLISSLGQPGNAQADSVIFRVFNDNDTLNHGNITITCTNQDGLETQVSTGLFVIGTSESLLQTPHYVSVGCPADHSYFGSKWSWTHTGDGDDAEVVTTIKSNTLRHGSLPTAIARLGGNPAVIASLGPDDTYTLVGGVAPTYKEAPPFQSVESSSLIAPNVADGGIRGVLGRCLRAGYFEVATSDFDLAVPSVADLQIIAWQDPIPWPATDSAGEQAAYRYISQAVACATQMPPDCVNDDIRGSYVGSDAAPAIWSSRLQDLKYPATGAPFTEADFTAVFNQLNIEFGYVVWVESLHTQLKELLVDSAIVAQGYLTGIAQTVIDATKPKPTSPVAINVLKALGAVTQIASAAIPGTQAAAKAITAVLGAALNNAASLASTPAGTIDGRIDTTVGQLSTEATDSFVALNSGVSQMITNVLSDWAKLEFVGSRMASSNHPEWHFDPSSGAVQSMLKLAVERHYYERLMPLGFSIYENFGTAPAASLAVVNCGWFSDAPDVDWGAFIDYRRNDQPPGAENVFIVTESSNFSYPSFANTLFNPYDLNGLAITKMEFFTRWPLPRRIGCSR